jgi:hypothetical protein
MAMRDIGNSKREMTDRRSVLAAGGATLVGLGALSSIQAVNAQEDSEWPFPEEEEREEEWNEPLPDDYEQQQTITDDTETIQITVPGTWNDIDSTAIDIGPSIVIAPDLEGYTTTWEVPGIEVVVTTELGSDPEAALNALIDGIGIQDACEGGDPQSFQSDGYTFLSQPWYQCGGTDTMNLLMVGFPSEDSPAGPPENQPPEPPEPPGNQPPENDVSTDAPYLILFVAQTITEEDWVAATGAISSLQIQSSGDQLP